MSECVAGVHGEDSRAFEDLRPDVCGLRVQLRLLHGPRQVRQGIRAASGENWV